MSGSRLAVTVLSAVGALALALAVGFLALARQGPGSTGFEDLAAIAGALLFASASGLASGAALLVAWRARVALRAWRLAIAATGAVAGLGAAGVLSYGAWTSGNGSLLAFGAVVGVVALAGLAGGVGARGRAAVTGRSS